MNGDQLVGETTVIGTKIYVGVSYDMNREMFCFIISYDGIKYKREKCKNIPSLPPVKSLT